MFARELLIILLRTDGVSLRLKGILRYSHLPLSVTSSLLEIELEWRGTWWYPPAQSRVDMKLNSSQGIFETWIISAN